MSSLDAELFIEVGHTVGVDVRGLTLKDQAGLVLARWEAKKIKQGCVVDGSQVGQAGGLLSALTLPLYRSPLDLD